MNKTFNEMALRVANLAELDSCEGYPSDKFLLDFATRIKEELCKGQEPVAWIEETEDGNRRLLWQISWRRQDYVTATPLYLHPAPIPADKALRREREPVAWSNEPIQYQTCCVDGTIFNNEVVMPNHAVKWRVISHPTPIPADLVVMKAADTIEALRRERDHYREQAAKNLTTVGKKLDELAAFKQYGAKLLRKYSKHTEDCAIERNTNNDCTCGLADELEGGNSDVCAHGIHHDNACGACVPPRGTRDEG